MTRIRLPSGRSKIKPLNIKTIRKEMKDRTFNGQLLYVGHMRTVMHQARAKARQNPDDATAQHNAGVAEINFRNAFREATGHEPPVTLLDE